MVDYLKHAYTWLQGWLPYVLPAFSNFILVLLGVIMSLPKLAEAIENNPKHRQGLAAVCIVAGLIGLGFDVAQRRSGDVQTRTLVKNVGTLVNDTGTLISNTNTLVGTTNSTVVNIGLLLPQINTLNAHVTEFDRKIEAAKGNPQ